MVGGTGPVNDNNSDGAGCGVVGCFLAFLVFVAVTTLVVRLVWGMFG